MSLHEANAAMRTLAAKGYECRRQRERPGPFGWVVIARDPVFGIERTVTYPSEAGTMVAATPAPAVCRRCEEGFCCGHCSCCKRTEIEAKVDAYDVVTAAGGEHRSLVDLVLAASTRLEEV